MDKKFYWDNGNLKKEGRMTNGKAEGLWTDYYESGEKKSETYYKNGIRDGHVITYWPNGKEKGLGEYVDDQFHGRWTSWYENGIKEEEGELVHGKAIGRWKRWRMTGSLEWESLYAQGLIDGLQIFYDSLGSKREEQWYHEGVLKSKTVYDHEGFIVDAGFSWGLDELPPFRKEYIRLIGADTILEPGVEYRFTVSIPEISQVYFQTSVTNAILYKASGTEYALKAGSGPETCIKLVLSLGDTIKIPYGSRCFSVGD